MSSPTSQNHPSEKVSKKKSLTLRSNALQKDDERPAQQPDNALQAAAEPGQKYGGNMAASPYRKMKKGQRRPHGVGPKDPKPNAAFWCPKERWNSAVQNAPPNQKPTSRQPMRNSQTPPRHEPKVAKTAPQKKMPNAAFWCPKERWNSTLQNAPPNQKPNTT